MRQAMDLDVDERIRSPDALARHLKSSTNRYTLRMWIIAMLVWYCFRLIVDLAVVSDLNESIGTLLSAALTVAILFVTWWTLGPRRAQGKHIYAVAVLIVIIALSNAVFYVWTSSNVNDTYRLASVLLIAGIIAQQFRYWLIMVAIIFTISVALSARLGFDLGYVIQLMVMHLIMSALIYLTREPLLSMLVSQSMSLVDRAEEVEATRAAQERFVANCTHELRTPMTGVLGVMDLLRASGVNEEQTRLLDIADSSAKQMLGVVNEILTFSKIHAGEVKMKPQPVDLVALSTDAWRSLQPMAESEELFFRLSAPDEPCWANADSKRIREIILNLLGNAIKYTQSGGVELVLSADLVGDEVIAVWRVSDTGSGISQDDLERIFEPFSRHAESGSKNVPGTGLGLTIAQQLTESMGGTLTVDSQVDMGSTFTLTIPFKRAVPEQEKALDYGEEQPGVLDQPLSVLVAEDNALNKMLIEQMLGNIGWKIKVVANGQLAVEEATRTDIAYDLVLLDIQMPVLDGVSAAKAILEQAESPPVLVAFTANTLPADVQSYLDVGMSAVVGKPLQLDELLETVSSVLEARQGRS